MQRAIKRRFAKFELEDGKILWWGKRTGGKVSQYGTYLCFL